MITVFWRPTSGMYGVDRTDRARGDLIWDGKEPRAKWNVIVAC